MITQAHKDAVTLLINLVKSNPRIFCRDRDFTLIPLNHIREIICSRYAVITHGADGRAVHARDLNVDTAVNVCESYNGGEVITMEALKRHEKGE